MSPGENWEKVSGAASALAPPSRLGIFSLANTSVSYYNEIYKSENQITERENIVENSHLRPKEGWKLVSELVRPCLTPARDGNGFFGVGLPTCSDPGGAEIGEQERRENNSRDAWA